MRNFGFKGYDNVIHPGTNGKMIEVCAAMGLSNLDMLDDVFAGNHHNHAIYKAALGDLPGIRILDYVANERNSHHYIVAEVGEYSAATRDEIVAALHAENVLARKYFWPGCHKMKPYRDLFPHAGAMLRSTESLAAKIVVLPNGKWVGDAAIHSICDIFSVLANP